MSNENNRKPRRAAGAALAARQADVLARILAELQQLRRELKERDVYYESVGVPVRPVAED